MLETTTHRARSACQTASISKSVATRELPANRLRTPKKRSCGRLDDVLPRGISIALEQLRRKTRQCGAGCLKGLSGHHHSWAMGCTTDHLFSNPIIRQVDHVPKCFTLLCNPLLPTGTGEPLGYVTYYEGVSKSQRGLLCLPLGGQHMTYG